MAVCTPCLLAEAEHLQRELVLDQRITPGNRDPSARLAVELDVAQEGCRGLLRGDPPPSNESAVVGQAATQAPQRVQRSRSIRDEGIGVRVEADRADRAARLAQAAADALLLEVPEAERGVESLGILAPCAAQAAAFQEEGGADAVAVMEREALDVNDRPVHQMSP